MARKNKESKQIVYILYILGFLILFFGAISLSGTGSTLLTFFKSLSVQFGFLILSILAYSTTIFAGNLMGLGKNKGFHIISGIGITIGYIVVSSLIPGFSIATPLLPGAISDGLRFLIIGIVAPVVESIALLGVLFSILRKKMKPLYAILMVGLISALFHSGSYVVGLYDYNFSQGLLGLSQNVSVFISAFVFFSLSAWLVNLRKYKGLLVSIIFHIGVNIFVYTTFAITFAILLGIL